MTSGVLRVLVVTNLYPPHAFGGYEDLCAGAVRSWRSAGHEVEVLASTWKRDGVDDVEQPGVHRALPIYWDDHRIVHPSLATAGRWERRTREVVAAVVDRFRPDVASVWNAGALSFGTFTYLARHDVPAVLVVGDRWLEWGVAADRWAAAWTRRPLVRLARSGLSTSLSMRPELAPDTVATFATEHLRSRAVARGSVAVPRTALVPHGVDLDRHPLADDAGAAPWTGRLLYVGRLAPQKGVATAVRALARLPGATLTVVGTGAPAYVAELRALASSSRVAERVEFVGEAGPDVLRERYAEADALVFPSTWEEPFGIVPLEAMAHGTPVVATGTGGSGEFLHDRLTALRFPPDDDAALADAVGSLASDAALRRDLVHNGFEVARWLDRARTYDDLVRWHEHVAGRPVEPPSERTLLPPGLR